MEFNIKKFGKVKSTNALAKKEELFTVIVAKSQTEGRGRGDKSFFSPRGGIYMSAVMPKTELSTIRTATAVLRSIERLSRDKPSIKWVNDIFISGKKVCGILLEGGENGTVCGIGINIKRKRFPKEIKHIAGSVKLFWKKEVLIKDILKELSLVWNADKEAVLREYESRLFMLGERVEYQKNGERKSGIAKGINGVGNLIVKTDGGEDILNSGEISLEKHQLFKKGD